MRTDTALDTAVRRFVEAVTPAMARAASAARDGRPDKSEDDAVLEAYNLAQAFIDADGLATDNELWALIDTFAARLDIPLLRATPADLRQAGVVRGTRHFLDAPSAMFEILLAIDRRDGTDHATRYQTHAVEIGHAIASLDLHTSTVELRAIESFRGMLLEARRDAEQAPDQQASADQPDEDRPTAAGEATGEQAEAAEEEPLPPPRPLDELLGELDDLVGLDAVKEEVKLVASLIEVQNLRRQRGLAVLEQSRHLVFTGNPGTGKTTVARLLAQIYRTLGVVERGHLVETDRAGLVAGFVGQTATKVTEVFDRADQGVLLIDEAYALVRGSEQDFGREAIDTIVKLVEDRRERVVVIVAGYPDEMQAFVDANPGLRSRFPKTIHFPDYDTDELLLIFQKLCEKGHYIPDEGALARVREVLDGEPRTKGFGNGRLARNLFEAAVARQARRIVELDDVSDIVLVTITADDIPPLDSRPVDGEVSA